MAIVFLQALLEIPVVRYLLLIFGVFCCSTSVIFIKIGQTDPVVLSAYRLLLGGFFLVPFAIKPLQRMESIPWGQLLRRSLPPAVFLAIHFTSWIFGARLTPSANASLIVNMVAVVMPLLLLVVIKERINQAEGFGTIIAMSGVFLLGAADYTFSRENAFGDAVCFLSMLFYAFYLIFARKNKDLTSIYLYVVPVYITAGLFCLGLAALLNVSGRPVIWMGPDLKMEWLSILGLALIPTVLGHSITNWAFQVIRGQVVAILNLSQFIFAGIMGFLILSEVPHAPFYVASALVFLGAVLVILKSRRTT